MITANTAVAVVIDKPTAARIAKDMTAMGGAWSQMFDVWFRSEYRYLVLLADSPERIRLKAPLTYLAADDDGLRDALDACCQRLPGVRCAWSLFIEKDSAAAVLTRTHLLLDFEPQGNG